VLESPGDYHRFPSLSKILNTFHLQFFTCKLGGSVVPSALESFGHVPSRLIAFYLLANRIKGWTYSLYSTDGC
jgi:hypothetical protein